MTNILGGKTYTVTRPGAVDYSESLTGTQEESTTFTAVLSIQEAKMNELALIKDIRLGGKDIKGCIRIYTETELQVNDTFTYQGQSYLVADVLARDNDMGLDHYKCFAILDDSGAG